MEIGNVRLINIEDEMRGAYIDYAMSVITARALPDVRDGLKPVQRRILYAMDEIGLRHTSPYKKSARIVGEVLGKYHPHGDASVYETMVRMAQDFSMRYILVDGQGNFGSVDGDPPAAMRYTEARLAAIAEELLADIDKNTVDFAPNFDGSLKEPTVLPAKLPNLLLNGSAGIAVGMATNIPPHNLNEVADAIIYMITHFGQALESGVPFGLLWSRVLGTSTDHQLAAEALKAIKPDLRTRVKEEAAKLSKKVTDEVQAEALVHILNEMIDIPPDKLMEFVKGPDFPTAGIILGEEGIKNAYTTGHGRITIRAKAHVEEMRGNRHQIIVTQLPFQVNKATLQEKIAELVRDRRIEGISELRDESDRQGMRVVIELKRETQPKQVLNQLFKYTAMQNTFSINMLALVDGQPRVLTLKMILLHYLNYRKEVITRRTLYDLEKARHRAHILEGLKIALDNLDEVISTIRKSRDAETAKTALMKNFKLTEIQAQAILDMQLRRLAALERKKIIDELHETLKLIDYLEDLLAHPGKILFLIKDELTELKEKYGDARRTKIVAEEATDFTEEDLIPDEPILVAITGKNYVKRMPADTYRASRKAKAIAGTISKEDDPPLLLASASTLDQIIFFSNRGRAFQTKAIDLPDAGRQAKGLPLSNFITLQPEERIVGAVGARSFDKAGYVVFVTAKGDIKRVSMTEYSSARANGVIALSVTAGDEVVWVGNTNGDAQIIVVTNQGQAIRFAEADVRASGRTSGGMRAIKLGKDDRVTDADVITDEVNLAIVSKNGLGKRSALDEFPVHGRGGSGVKAATVNDKTGTIVSAKVVNEADEIAITSAVGSVFRTSVEGMPLKGRALALAPLMTLDKNDKVTALLRIQGKGNGNGKPAPTGEDDSSPNGSVDVLPSKESKSAPKKSAPKGSAVKKTDSAKKASATKASSDKREKKSAEKPVAKAEAASKAAPKAATVSKPAAKIEKPTAKVETVSKATAKAEKPATKVETVSKATAKLSKPVIASAKPALAPTKVQKQVAPTAKAASTPTKAVKPPEKASDEAPAVRPRSTSIAKVETAASRTKAPEPEPIVPVRENTRTIKIAPSLAELKQMAAERGEQWPPPVAPRGSKSPTPQSAEEQSKSKTLWGSIASTLSKPEEKGKAEDKAKKDPQKAIGPKGKQQSLPLFDAKGPKGKKK